MLGRAGNHGINVITVYRQENYSFYPAHHLFV